MKFRTPRRLIETGSSHVSTGRQSCDLVSASAIKGRYLYFIENAKWNFQTRVQVCMKNRVKFFLLVPQTIDYASRLIPAVRDNLVRNSRYTETDEWCVENLSFSPSSHALHPTSSACTLRAHSGSLKCSISLYPINSIPGPLETTIIVYFLYIRLSIFSLNSPFV